MAIYLSNLIYSTINKNISFVYYRILAREVGENLEIKK